MKFDIKNPKLTAFFDITTKQIISNVGVKDYFMLNNKEKLTKANSVLTIIRHDTKSTLSDYDFKDLLTIMRCKTENDENYELAAILFDIVMKYDKISKLNCQKNKNLKV